MSFSCNGFSTEKLDGFVLWFIKGTIRKWLRCLSQTLIRTYHYAILFNLKATNRGREWCKKLPTLHNWNLKELEIKYIDA